MGQRNYLWNSRESQWWEEHFNQRRQHVQGLKPGRRSSCLKTWEKADMAGTCEQEETSEDEVGKIGGFKSWGVIWNTPHTSCQRFEISFKWKLKKETKNFAFLLNYHCRKWTFRGKSGTPISNLGDNVAWIKVLKVDMVTSKYDVWFGGWNMSRLYIVTLLI